MDKKFHAEHCLVWLHIESLHGLEDLPMRYQKFGTDSVQVQLNIVKLEDCVSLWCVDCTSKLQREEGGKELTSKLPEMALPIPAKNNASLLVFWCHQAAIARLRTRPKFAFHIVPLDLDKFGHWENQFSVQSTCTLLEPGSSWVAVP